MDCRALLIFLWTVFAASYKWYAAISLCVILRMVDCNSIVACVSSRTLSRSRVVIGIESPISSRISCFILERGGPGFILGNTSLNLSHKLQAVFEPFPLLYDGQLLQFNDFSPDSHEYYHIMISVIIQAFYSLYTSMSYNIICNFWPIFWPILK